MLILARAPDETKLLAGGQSLIPLLNFRLVRPALVLDISRLPLSAISLEGDVLRIGALASHSAVANSSLVRQHVPLLATAIAHVGHAAIRTRGTIGGSLAHADPAAEVPAVLLAYRAVVTVQGPGGERRLALDNLLLQRWTTTLHSNEIITSVEIPVSGPGTRAGFGEFSHRAGDFAIAGACVVAQAGVGLAVLFGVGERPVAGELPGGDLEADADEIVASIAPQAEGWTRACLVWSMRQALDDARD